MDNPLFSTYRTGENRVTSTILSVFERMSLRLVEYLLQSIVAEPEKNLIEFRSQVSGPDSVPDGRIASSFCYYIETKMKSDSINQEQLDNHLHALAQENCKRQLLLILTPDENKPQKLAQYESENRVVWSNFIELANSPAGIACGIIKFFWRVRQYVDCVYRFSASNFACSYY